MIPKLLVGVDEFTVMLHLNEQINNLNWSEKAFEYIQRFLKLSKLTELFGEISDMYSQLPAGYTTGYTFERLQGYFSIAYNLNFSIMGVCIKWSAESWAYYQSCYKKLFNETITVNKFLHNTISPLYHIRVSRIDLTADYFDYDNISPELIYSDLQSGRVSIVDHNMRSAKRKLSMYGKDGKVQSLFIGSKKSNTRSVARIYDKKCEQLEHIGFRYDEARKHTSWVRMEMSYRGEFARTIGQQLILDVHSDIELSQFIASHILDKYRFYVNDEQHYTEYTNDLLSIVGNSDFPALRTENPKNNSLSKSIAYIIKGSGLYPLLFKVFCIWGDKAEIELLNMFYEIYIKYFKKDFERDLRLKKWVEKNYFSLSQQTLESCFVGGDLDSIDIDKVVERISDNDIFNLKELHPKEINATETKNYDEEISEENFLKMLNYEDI